MTATADDVGKYAQALTTQGIVHASGPIISYWNGPTVTIADRERGHVAWRADLTEVLSRTALPPPGVPDNETTTIALAVAAERARIIAAVATPDSDLLAALIGINESAKLMREWFLSIVNDEDDEDYEDG